MKKWIALLLAAMMVFSMAACAAKNEPAADQANEAADERGGGGEQQGVADTGEISGPEIGPKLGDVAAERNQPVHRGSFPRWSVEASGPGMRGRMQNF